MNGYDEERGSTIAAILQKLDDLQRELEDIKESQEEIIEKLANMGYGGVGFLED